MAAINAEIRRGAYYDSVVLMQLQRALLELDGVLDAGVVMGTEANKEILGQSELLTAAASAAGAEDLVIVVKAQEEQAATAALNQVDHLLSRRRQVIEQEYQPKSLAAADQLLPESQWVLISTPGQYAAAVAREALRLDKHVFLYSDNVTLEDEVSLKREAAAKGLLVMGPDCGTALVNGVAVISRGIRRFATGPAMWASAVATTSMAVVSSARRTAACAAASKMSRNAAPMSIPVWESSRRAASLAWSTMSPSSRISIASPAAAKNPANGSERPTLGSRPNSFTSTPPR